MLDGLKRLMQEGLLLREIQGLRGDLQALTLAVTRIAAAVEYLGTSAYPMPAAPPPPGPGVDITYVDTVAQAEFADIELRLTQARGTPPTEEEMLAEYERRHQPPDQTVPWN